MFFAAIGDIKSNFLGLSAVLDAIENEGICLVLHTGNVCDGPENAQACVALIRERGVISVQGAHDRTLARLQKQRRHQPDDALGDTHAALGVSAVEYLDRLPRKRSLVEEGLRVVLCHGTINSAAETLSATTPLARFRRQRELDPADIVVCGGAPDPFAFTIDGALFLCPGTLDAGAAGARYTLVNTERLPWTATSLTVSKS